MPARHARSTPAASRARRAAASFASSWRSRADRSATARQACEEPVQPSRNGPSNERQARGEVGRPPHKCDTSRPDWAYVCSLCHHGPRLPARAAARLLPHHTCRARPSARKAFLSACTAATRSRTRAERAEAVHTASADATSRRS
jgi:hypothetical protein